MSKREFSDGDFSDIEKLVPKEHVTSVTAASHDTSAVYLEFGEEKKQSGLALGQMKHDMSVTPEYTYEPENSLITAVTVRPRLSPTRFYADFVNDAKKYINMHGKACAPVPFPAYIPEYRSMKKAQLDYYLYFRDMIREGKTPNAPHSYILLLLFEIINLPNEIEHSEGAYIMYRLWKNYRHEYPRLDTYIPEWLCDYSLIHKTSLPEFEVRDAQILAELSDFPEFYLNLAECDRYTLLCKTAGYTPNSDGRYPETEPYLREHVLNAVDAVSLQKYNRSFAPENYLTLSSGARVAYRSALCSYENNALISFTYRSFSKKTAAMNNLCECIKYAENKVRAYLCIRARHKCPNLDYFEKNIIDSYFDEHLTIEKKKTTKVTSTSFSSENDYMYEPESVGISFDAAKEIEKASWKATAMLEEAFEDVCESIDETVNEEIDTPEAAKSGGLGKDEFEFLRILYFENNSAANDFAKSIGVLSEAIAEKINVYAFDMIGDSVIETIDGELAVIEDYEEEIKEWLSN